MTVLETLQGQCTALRMPTARAVVAELLDQARRNDWDLDRFTVSLLDQEIEGRRQRRVERLASSARLPVGKTLATLDQERLTLRLRRQLQLLQDGSFVDRAENVLIFGLPGRGKTHLAAAIGHELVQAGRRVLFTPCFKLIGRLLRAKRDLDLERELRILDRFELLILDDIGYVQQDRDEMEVLFTLLAERYERRSTMITSNLVFSEWGRIFKDPMTTASAIDRLVHHSVILEFGKEMPSVRAQHATERNQPTSDDDPPMPVSS